MDFFDSANEPQQQASKRTNDEGASEREMSSRLDRLWHKVRQQPEPNNARTIGKYKLQHVLGGGSFGVVYFAIDTTLGRPVAIKLPRLDVLLDENKRARFAIEAETAANLEHPGIISIFEADLERSEPYIAMAYCDGPNLAEWMTVNRKLHSWQSLAALVAEIAMAVDHAHQRDILHRDLKPANIIMAPRTSPIIVLLQDQLAPIGRLPVLTDFGLAKFLSEEGIDTRSSILLGTPLYAAPEQLAGVKAQRRHPPTPAVDVYSLGVILFELLTGQTPLDGDDYLDIIASIRNRKPMALRKLRPDCPRSLEIICAKCLEKQPEHRYSTGAELAEDLQRCILANPIVGRLPSRWQRAKTWMTAPERVPWAGWYAIAWHAIFATWLALTFILLPFKVSIETSEWMNTGYRVAYGILFSFTPVFFFAWWTIHRKRWALYCNFILSLGKAAAFANATFFTSVIFYRYATVLGTDPAYSFVDRFLFLICMIVQVFFYGCAIAADRKHRFCETR